jgi:hypothetical protein
MSARPWRQRVLFGALAITLVLSAAQGIGRKGTDEPIEPPHKPVPGQPKQPEQPRIELAPLQRQAAPAEADMPASHAFRSMSWYVPPPPPPPPPPPKPMPPPPPSAPPMPFSFLGRYEEGETRIILLVRGERIYTVSEGEVIDNTYRVGRLTSGQLELTYLPLDIKQTISAGGT